MARFEPKSVLEMARFKPKGLAQFDRKGWHNSNRYIHQGELYSELKGKHIFQLDTLTINQLNHLFEIVDIWKYPNEELLPIPGTANMSLTIKYPEERTVEIKNGNFEGKHFIIQKVFNRFESLLIKKKAIIE